MTEVECPRCGETCEINVEIGDDGGLCECGCMFNLNEDGTVTEF